VEAAPPEGWVRWAMELGHYDKDRLAGFGGVIIASLLLGVVLLYLFVTLADEVLTQQTAALDTAAFQNVHRFSSPQMDVVATALSLMGSEAVLVLSVLVLGLFLWQRRWGAAAMLILISGGVQLLNDVLKSTFHRSRPVPLMGIITAQQYSFPSGHAMVASAFYLYLAYLCWRLVRGVWRFVLIAGLMLLVLLIGLARIYLQAHFLTDVIAGYIGGLLWADAVIVGSQLLVTRRLRGFGRRPLGQARTLNG
ncbi:MAG: phosphatase PAP2 family protein, partial [Chloroflexi bacterium]|nr:phosphatase PAP2 family protein [Chloroflexota bacterium]